jgi:hypothetical protein
VVGVADLARSSSISAAEIFYVKVFINSVVPLIVMVAEEVAELL